MASPDVAILWASHRRAVLTSHAWSALSRRETEMAWIRRGRGVSRRRDGVPWHGKPPHALHLRGVLPSPATVLANFVGAESSPGAAALHIHSALSRLETEIWREMGNWFVGGWATGGRGAAGAQ
ncbi:hypothetical protein ACP70R_042014 [Stipagrostis hirtigluma subsp. patula]